MRRIAIPAALIWSCFIGLGIAVAQPDNGLGRAREIGRTLAGNAINEVQEYASVRGKKGILVAEGDSWFNYPRSDVLKELSKIGYDVVSVAEKGDTAENMIYGAGSLVELAEKLEFLRRKNLSPVGFLLSAGGNDLAGPEIGMLLNHRQSGLDPYDADVINLVVHRRLRDAMISLLTAVDAMRALYFGDLEIPILIHGYDCPVPDGRGIRPRRSACCRGRRKWPGVSWAADYGAAAAPDQTPRTFRIASYSAIPAAVDRLRQRSPST